jgi:type IV secretory pathway TrbL component
MGIRDRFYTPRTARAILSWRILLGAGAGVAMAIAGLPVGVAVGVGVALYAASVATAMPRTQRRATIDPFTLGEPWRQLVQRTQAAGRNLRETVERTSDGPLRDTLASIAEQLERGIEEAWAIARRGDEIDDAVRRLDPTGLRSRLASAERRAADAPGPDADAAVASIRRQLESADRLRQQSEEAAASLRLTQTHLDELVARASEVQVGVVDTEAYRREVDDLVIRLEALHQAVEETRTT